MTNLIKSGRELFMNFDSLAAEAVIAHNPRAIGPR